MCHPRRHGVLGRRERSYGPAVGYREFMLRSTGRHADVKTAPEDFGRGEVCCGNPPFHDGPPHSGGSQDVQTYVAFSLPFLWDRLKEFRPILRLNHPLLLTHISCPVCAQTPSGRAVSIDVVHSPPSLTMGPELRLVGRNITMCGRPGDRRALAYRQKRLGRGRGPICSQGYLPGSLGGDTGSRPGLLMRSTIESSIRCAGRDLLGHASHPCCWAVRRT